MWCCFAASHCRCERRFWLKPVKTFQAEHRINRVFHYYLAPFILATSLPRDDGREMIPDPGDGASALSAGQLLHADFDFPN
jgi:hypothetical protein